MPFLRTSRKLQRTGARPFPWRWSEHWARRFAIGNSIASPPASVRGHYKRVSSNALQSIAGPVLIAYADTGFLVSLYGQDSNSAIATRLIRSKPVFLLTSVGEAEFTNAVELRVFRKDWTRLEARSVHDLFLQHQAAGVFRLAPRGSEIWEKALVKFMGTNNIRTRRPPPACLQKGTVLVPSLALC